VVANSALEASTERLDFPGRAYDGHALLQPNQCHAAAQITTLVGLRIGGDATAAEQV
jgi:hypothetical protein